MKYNLLIFLSLLFLTGVEAQNNANTQNTNYKINLNIPSQKGNKIYLGQYWKGSSIGIDSTLLSEQGKGQFSISKKLPGGQYFLFAKPGFQVDLLIGDNQKNDIYITVDEADPSKNTISGSRDSELLWKYLMDLDKIRLKKFNIEDALTDSTLSAKKKTELENQINDLNKQEELVMNEQIKKYEKEWFGIFLKGSTPITLPFPKPNSAEEYIENKNYGKIHFFDNLALNDSRIWNTNYVYSFIDSYMKQWIDQVPDSLAKAAVNLVEKTKDNEFAFKEMLSYLTNTSLKSNVMGDESIWAALFETYILDKDISWIDSTQTVQLRNMYEYLKNNRIGMKAHNLMLETIDGKTINTDEIDAKLLLLYFYDPNCSHCKVEIPKLHDKLYAKYKDKGFEVVAINIALNENNRPEWEKFVKDNNLSDWLNTVDPNYKSQYWMYFDTSGVPSAYILNKDKQILARKINEENIETVLKYYFENGTN